MDRQINKNWGTENDVSCDHTIIPKITLRTNKIFDNNAPNCYETICLVKSHSQGAAVNMQTSFCYKFSPLAMGAWGGINNEKGLK